MLRLVQKQKNFKFRTRNALLGCFRLQFKEETIECFKSASSNFGFVILNKTDIRVMGARKKSLFFPKLISAKIFLTLPEGFTLGNTLEDISFLTGICQD